MKLTNLELRNSISGLQELMTAKLSPLVALKVAKAIKVVEDKLKVVSEAEKNIIAQVQSDETDVDGNKLLEELYNVEEDVDVSTITVADLGVNDVTAHTLISLSWLIKEE